MESENQIAIAVLSFGIIILFVWYIIYMYLNKGKSIPDWPEYSYQIPPKPYKDEKVLINKRPAPKSHTLSREPEEILFI